VIGLDFPVKPEWIHDVHHLWRPEQPVRDLVQATLSGTMQELRGEKSRRNSLTVILRYFVTTEGGGQSRRTAAQDVWVAYSRRYPAGTMAPAYLAHLVAQNDVAHQAADFIARRYDPGDDLTSSELRRHLYTRFGQRTVVANAGSAFLSTLRHFGVLAPGERLGDYRFAARLPVPREVFPLVVWAWWQRSLSPQIDVAGFRQDPVMAFLQREGLMDLWRVYQPSLWTLEERLEGRRITLKHTTASAWTEALLALVVS
jgi:hypothetical protein